MASTALDRRNFLKVSLLAGGGLAIDFSLPLGPADAETAGSTPSSRSRPTAR